MVYGNRLRPRSEPEKGGNPTRRFFVVFGSDLPVVEGRYPFIWQSARTEENTRVHRARGVRQPLAPKAPTAMPAKAKISLHGIARRFRRVALRHRSASTKRGRGNPARSQARRFRGSLGAALESGFCFIAVACNPWISN